MLTHYSQRLFLDEYELSVEKEFEYDGHAARWAPGTDGPRLWDEEDALVDLKLEVVANESTRVRCRSAATMTADEKYLAVAREQVLRIYDVNTKRMCSELKGHTSGIQKLVFVTICSPTGGEFSAHYILLSESDARIFAWHIGENGRPIEIMADQAVDALVNTVKAHHEPSDSDVAARPQRVSNALQHADTTPSTKHIPSWEGNFNGFDSDPVSHNGRGLIYIAHGETTQREMRPFERLPQLVVLETCSLKERCRLHGCEDAIMWAGWSLDDSIIAAACWDQTFRLWNAGTGQCLHVISDTGGQNWRGAFLSDGKHVLFSGGKPSVVAIYEIETASKVAHLEPPEGIVLDDWMRCLTVHPTENLVILQNSRSLLAWRPFHKREGTSTVGDVQEILVLSQDDEWLKQHYGGLYGLKWVDDGRKLVAQGGDNTTFVWAKTQSYKWRFQRQKGREGTACQTNAFFAKRGGSEWILSADNDGKIRFWKL